MSNLKSQIPNQTYGVPLVTPEQLAALAALANGIIPSDATDAGAAEVNAAAKIAERIAGGVNAALYQQGLALAESLAHEKCHRFVAQLNAAEVHELLAALRDRLPAFFKQLRLDVSALLSQRSRRLAAHRLPRPLNSQRRLPRF